MDIVERLRKHVNDRGGASLENGAWPMMLKGADEIERLREALKLERQLKDDALRAFNESQAALKERE